MSRPLSFEEIVLRIQRTEPDGRCVVQVANSPYGSGAESPADFALLSSASDDPDENPLSLADGLFKTLFSGRVLEVFHKCVGRIEKSPGTGLRIRLLLDPANAQVNSLPWELLYRTETRDFLASNPHTPLVRELCVPRLTALEPIEPPLRILVIRSDPRDQGHRPNLNREQDQLEAAWGGHENTIIEFLRSPTLGALRRKLIDKAFHVLHFMGHGGFDAEAGAGALVFEDAAGNSAPVWGRMLAEAIKSCDSLRLIILNACETARLPRRGDQDPYLGVASALILAGIPAVVAMQLPISEEAAQTFSQRFYMALAAGFPVDAATAEARLAVHLECPDSWEWAVPALFMRTPDGQILLPPQSDPRRVISLCTLDRQDLERKKKRLGEREELARTSPEIPTIHFELGVRYLDLKLYEQALGSLGEAARRGCREKGLYFYTALATLGGKQPRILPIGRIREVEQHLRTAFDADGETSEALVLWAIIKSDFYQSKGLRVEKPPITDLLAAAHRCKSGPGDVHLLENHLRVPPTVAEFLSTWRRE